MSDEDFLDRLEAIYSEEFVKEVSWQLEAFRSDGLQAQAEELRERFFVRMHDLPAFMRELAGTSQAANARCAHSACGFAAKILSVSGNM